MAILLRIFYSWVIFYLLFFIIIPWWRRGVIGLKVPPQDTPVCQRFLYGLLISSSRGNTTPERTNQYCIRVPFPPEIVGTSNVIFVISIQFCLTKLKYNKEVGNFFFWIISSDISVLRTLISPASTEFHDGSKDGTTCKVWILFGCRHFVQPLKSHRRSIDHTNNRLTKEFLVMQIQWWYSVFKKFQFVWFPAWHEFFGWGSNSNALPDTF